MQQNILQRNFDKKVLIFGNDSFAELIYYMFQNYSNYEVSAFIVDEKYKNSSQFCSLPLLSLDSVLLSHSPLEYTFFVAIGYSNMNQLRADKYLQIKDYGYSFVNFIHPTAIISPNVHIGDNISIFENTVIQPYVEIGNNIIIWSSSTICHHSTICSNVFIASNVCVNGRVTIEENSFIGAGAIIKNDLKIGKHSLIGAGCTILKNTNTNYKCKASKNIDITI